MECETGTIFSRFRRTEENGGFFYFSSLFSPNLLVNALLDGVNDTFSNLRRQFKSRAIGSARAVSRPTGVSQYYSHLHVRLPRGKIS